jgi:PPM family protein phosphatase
MVVRFATYIHVVPATGRGEDRGAIINLPEGVVLVVADGAGGTGGGEQAAEFLVSAVRDAALSARDVFDVRYWTAILLTADQQMASRKNAGECTAVVVAVSDGGLVGVSVGDSAAWLCRDAEVDDLSEHQIRKPLLGTGGAIPIPFERVAHEGVLLLGTDGLFKYTTSPCILEALRVEDLSQMATRLVDLVRLRSGGLPDDVAIALCRKSICRP